MTRLDVLTPAQLSPEQRAVYDAITGGPRAAGPSLLTADGGLVGPFNALLYAPGVGQALQDLGAAVRYRTALSTRIRELAVLAVAAHWHCDFEWQAHEALARNAGVTDAELDALRAGAQPPLTDGWERAALDVVRALLLRADLDDGEYAEARDDLGEPALVELSTLVGYYALLALQLRIFRVTAGG